MVRDPGMARLSNPAATSSADRVFSILKSRILSLEYSPGQPLTELGVAEDLNVSRTPIREALRRLEHEHLVQIIPRKGAVVTGVSEEDIVEVYLIRQALEGISTNRAAALLSDENLKQLGQSVFAAAERLADHDRQGAAEAAGQLHRLVLSVGGTPRLLRIVQNLKGLTGHLHDVAISLPGCLERSIEEHRRVIDALERRDGDEAEKWMRRHLANTERDVMTAFRNRRAADPAAN
jgi:DNA-binding GntR family transcriptional regulator